MRRRKAVGAWWASRVRNGLVVRWKRERAAWRCAKRIGVVLAGDQCGASGGLDAGAECGTGASIAFLSFDEDGWISGDVDVEGVGS